MYWAYDIETSEWDKLVVAVALSERGDKLVMRSDDACAAWYKSLPSTDIVLAHNGGHYDFIQLIAAAPDLQWSAKMAGSAIVSCRAKGHAECRDTYRLFPLSLAKWTQRKEETGLPCACDKGCGGYCSIRPDMDPYLMKRLTDYCARDCSALLDTYLEDIDGLLAEGLDVIGNQGSPRLTLGAVAWATASRMAGIDAKEQVSLSDYAAGRSAYYGGRCEVNITQADSGYRYDVNAMYPWALLGSVPVGRRRTVLRDDATAAFEKLAPGVYHASLLLAETDLPELPHRYHGPTKGRLTRDRLLWTTGNVDGWYTPEELSTAIECGAKLLQLDAAHLWDSEDAVFAPYVEHIYACRRRAKEAGNDRWAGVLKWYANSLTGKLAQRPDVATLHVIPIDDLPSEGWELIGMNERAQVFAEPGFRLSPCSRSWQAATLTGRARSKLLRRLHKHRGLWLYCDTDSTYLVNRDDDGVDSAKLGAWAYEGEARQWLCLAPKLYRFVDERGAKKVRARGIPQPTWETLDELRNGLTVARERGVLGLRSSGGRFRRRTVKRSHRDRVTGRVGTRFATSDGHTRPLHRTRDGEYV